jgi:hypothetical protein
VEHYKVLCYQIEVFDNDISFNTSLIIYSSDKGFIAQARTDIFKARAHKFEAR